MIRLIEGLFLTMSCLALTSLIAIIIRQISQLNMQLRTLNEQNAKLLDGMHEGLIIISKKKEHRVLYSNKPIQKFINAAIQAAEEQIDSDQQSG